MPIVLPTSAWGSAMLGWVITDSTRRLTAPNSSTTSAPLRLACTAAAGSSEAKWTSPAIIAWMTRDVLAMLTSSTSSPCSRNRPRSNGTQSDAIEPLMAVQQTTILMGSGATAGASADTAALLPAPLGALAGATPPAAGAPDDAAAADGAGPAAESGARGADGVQLASASSAARAATAHARQ